MMIGPRPSGFSSSTSTSISYSVWLTVTFSFIVVLLCSSTDVGDSTVVDPLAGGGCPARLPAEAHGPDLGLVAEVGGHGGTDGHQVLLRDLLLGLELCHSGLEHRDLLDERSELRDKFLLVGFHYHLRSDRSEAVLLGGADLPLADEQLERDCDLTAGVGRVDDVVHQAAAGRHVGRGEGLAVLLHQLRAAGLLVLGGLDLAAEHH